MNVLFLCTGNTARSILAESLLNAMGQGRVRAYGAGSHPKGTVNRFALELIERHGLPAEGLRSKSWDELAPSGAPEMDFVFTVCDQAAGEACPVWPGQPIVAHWGVPDPAAVEGSDEARRRAFLSAFAEPKRRIELFLALSLSRLDRIAITSRVQEIGRPSPADRP